MTPKEIAKELIDNSYDVCPYHTKVVGVALLIVDEILDRLIWHTGASDLGNTILIKDIEYWQEVKKEIEKL